MTALTLRVVFRLPLRQTEGFQNSILRLMDLDLVAPDHRTLSRRNRDVDVPLPTRRHDGPIHLVVDSSGLKILGGGEWHRRKHKTRTRRTRRKFHIGVDADGFIVASKLTGSGVGDASQVPELLKLSDELKAAARGVRETFVPARIELQASYADEASKAITRQPKLAEHAANFQLLPVPGDGNLGDWTSQFVQEGLNLGQLKSDRADVTAESRASAGVLRSATLGLITRFRAAVAEELEVDPELPRDLDKSIFGFLDELIDG